MKILSWLCGLAVPSSFAFPTDSFTTDMSAHGFMADLVARALSLPSVDLASRPSGQLHRRDTTRTMCVPADPNTNARLRSLSEPALSRSGGTLTKRVMRMPDDPGVGNIDHFMIVELNKAFEVVLDNTVSTSVYRELKAGIKPFGLGTCGLKGCTTLVIVSHKAVFFAHYYEDISFSPPGADAQAQQAAFQSTVLDGLRDGIPPRTPGGLDVQVSLKNIADDFKDGHAEAHLLIPSTGPTVENFPDGRPDPYRAMWNQMRDAIVGNQGHIPNIPWNEHTYTPVTTDEEEAGALGAGARGAVLYKFDPNQNTARSNLPRNLAVLWFEHNVVYRDAW